MSMTKSYFARRICLSRSKNATIARHLRPRKKNDIGERRMAAHELSVFRRDQPVNARPRITRAQLHKHWDRMDDVTEGRRFDQQNAREPCRLQCRRAAVLYSCVL